MANAFSPEYVGSNPYYHQVMRKLTVQKFCVLLAFLLFLLLGVSAQAAPRTSGLWWMPEVASKAGHDIDQVTYFIYYLTGGVFVLTQVVFVYFLIKYRASR